MKIHLQLAIRSTQQPERINTTSFSVSHKIKLMENVEIMSPIEIRRMRKLKNDSLGSNDNGEFATNENIHASSRYNFEPSV
jgi:hypothetical protein